jgi:hypothetical protein
MAGYVLMLWRQLASFCMDEDNMTLKPALRMLRPGVLRLLQHLALHPPPPLAIRSAPASQGLQIDDILLSTGLAIQLCATLLGWQWRRQLRQMTTSTPPAAAHATTATSSSNSSSSSSSSIGLSADLMALTMGQQVSSCTTSAVYTVLTDIYYG